MSLTAKGNELLGILQKMLEEKGADASVSVEEISEYSDKTIASIRGTMGKLAKEDYIVSEAVEVEEGKKRKRISLTDQGWEVDTTAYKAAE